MEHQHLMTLKTKGGTIINLTKFKQSDLWVDITTGLFFKSPTELIVVGRINQLYEQPLICIDGYAFDLILKHNFEYDESLLNEEGRNAADSYKKQISKSPSNSQNIEDDIELKDEVVLI